MFANSKAVSIMVNPNSKKTIWSNGSNYAGCRDYKIDELLEALEIILFNTYIMFIGCIFKQILGIILYLSWCEYDYFKTDYAMTKLLSYYCRYLDDICASILVTLQNIYITAHCCSKVVHAVKKQDTFLDLYIRVLDGNFVTGIYHKVDDVNFEVINFPIPQSIVPSMLGYTTFYSRLIRFLRLCNNINDFLFRSKLSYFRLVKRGYMHILLFKYFKRFFLAY